MVELHSISRFRRRDSYVSKFGGGSKSSRLLLESVSSSEWAPLPGYERLSQSMRFFDEPLPERRQKPKLWKFLGQVFSRKERTAKVVARDPAASSVEGKTKEKKRRLSWLPDPDRRWPVQGW